MLVELHDLANEDKLQAAGDRHLNDDEQLYLRLLNMVSLCCFTREEICTHLVN